MDPLLSTVPTASAGDGEGSLPASRVLSSAIDPALLSPHENDESEWEYEYSSTETEVGVLHLGP